MMFCLYWKHNDIQSIQICNMYWETILFFKYEKDNKIFD